MEDPSVSKRLLDFGIDEHDYDEVDEQSTTTPSTPIPTSTATAATAATAASAALPGATNIITAATATAVNDPALSWYNIDSSNRGRSSISNIGCINNNNNNNNNNTNIINRQFLSATELSTTTITEEITTPPELPPPKQKHKQRHSFTKDDYNNSNSSNNSNINNNNNNTNNNNNNNNNNKINNNFNKKVSKTKSNKLAKSSKIPRSPSFANTLNGIGYPNFQPPPISGIPTQKSPPPLPPLLIQSSHVSPIKSILNTNGTVHNVVGNFFNAVNHNSNNNSNNNNNSSNKNKTNNNNNNNNLQKNSINNSNSCSNKSKIDIMTGGGNNNNNLSGICGKTTANSLTTSNGQLHRNSANMGRRTPLHISSNLAGDATKNFQYLTLTIRKDENGYGMKVSGDKPVFVESVRPGGAAQIAGLIAGDMILKVNGTEVRSEKHPTVVALIKASTIVELVVKRNPLVMPSTPVLSGRDRTTSITGPQPVDSIKRREMETYKIQTLQKMLEQEKLNLERLKGDTNNPSYKLSEANIRTLREQLRQVGAEALGQTPHNLSHVNKHRRVISSPDTTHSRHPERQLKTNSDSWELLERDYEDTPPGTPPPPYRHAHSASMSGNEDGMLDHFISPAPPAHSSRMQAAQMISTQKEIISMEDEDASDQEGPFIDENGPFNSFQRLLETENVAFLAVFLNYVLSNSEPAPLLFYLITGLCKEGTAKDMRKWVYEIHSTFLVPRAPLSWYRLDETLAREVDAVLQNEFDKVEILRKVFWKSRKKARDIICEQLREFQAKRTAGLGTIYGPTDAQLLEAKGDKQKEQHIFEETLMKKLQILLEEFEKDAPLEDPRKSALCSALSTVIHRIFITRPNSIIDRVNQFVNREKSFKSLIMGKKGKNIVRGHPLVLRQYYEVTHCNHCQTIIWGISPQGFHCTDCKLNIHRLCSKVLEENCPGPLPQAKRKDKDLHNDNKISKLMGKIRPRTSTDLSGDKRSRPEPDDFDPLDFPNERSHFTSIQRQPSDRRSDAANVSLRSNGNNSAHINTSDLQNSFHGGDSTTNATGITGSNGGSCPTTLLPCNSSQDGMNISTTSALSGTTGSIISGGISPGGIIGALNELKAQDASESTVVRRERLHHQHQQNKSAPVSVNRSESYKERLSHKRNRSQRKTSDPSLTSRPNDDQQHDLGLSNTNFKASSNSSLSSSGGCGSESLSNSMEQMSGSGVTATTTANASVYHHHNVNQHQYHQHHHHPHNHHHHQQHHFHQHHPQHIQQQDSFHGSGVGAGVGIGVSGGSSNASFWSGSSHSTVHSRPWHFDSDDDDDIKEADWSSYVAAEILAALTDAEKKRQEIINEIYQTERSHVRTLKLLERLFFFPLQESGLLSQEHLLLLFPPSLVSLCDLHGNFEQKLKQRRVDHNYVVNSVGDLLAGMFDGKDGEELREYARQFCARQQIALEALKEKRRKDENLQKLLTKAESHKACRRLQLKDLLPTVLQRLTKYPLLFENLYKVTIRVQPEDTNEAEAIQKALESSKKILVDVNQAVKTAEDAHKLQNIQKKLDKSTFDKDEFKNLDLTQHRLIHDGSLTMKKNPSIQLHGLLFENMIVLLTKQDDKYLLKYLHATRNAEVNNKPVSPIMSIDSETLVRQEAADKNSFFLIKTKTSQMLELRAPSSSECKTWFKHISDAAEQYKPRSKNVNHETVDDPAIATIPHSNTRESLEMTPERSVPQAATATVVTTPLAPMMPLPSTNISIIHDKIVNAPINYNNNDVQLRNARRENTPMSVPVPASASSADYYNLKQRSSHNELTPNTGAVNRTMSTRSCGEANTNYSNIGEFAAANGVALRHTQSARQANGSGDEALAESPNKRDSASIVYSNNSNSTRTLMQPPPPLVDPKAIQISISPAHTAQPVLTPAEKLKRLDASIREGLMEKQKIICDMFRLPIEHFHEIVDIAAMPEAPKDSADIALAAYAQVQTLTEVFNEYMQVKPEKEILGVSKTVCNKCYEKQQQNDDRSKPLTDGRTGKFIQEKSEKQIDDNEELPPPLPPPKKQIAQAQQPTPMAIATKLQSPPCLMESDIHEDDDGYCELDELRLPALPHLLKVAPANTSLLGKSQVAPSPPPQSLPIKNCFNQAATNNSILITPPIVHGTCSTPELAKRQSIISADSIPEESADEVTNALNDAIDDVGHHKDTTIQEISTESKEILAETVALITKETDKNSIANADNKEDKIESDVVDKVHGSIEYKVIDEEKVESEGSITPTEVLKDSYDNDENDNNDDKDEDSAMHTAECESPDSEDIRLNERCTEEHVETHDAANTNKISTTTFMSAEPQQQNHKASTTISNNIEMELLHASEHMEINEAYETLSSLQKANAALSMVDSSTQTLPLTTALLLITPNSSTNGFNTISTTTTQNSTNDATEITITSTVANTNTNTTITQNISSNNYNNNNTNVHINTSTASIQNGLSRVQQATTTNTLGPSVPCYALSSIVNALNAQISLLLPKINERDIERERLRRENLHLRELLNAMHDRLRVESKMKTPSDTSTSVKKVVDEIDGFSPAVMKTPTSMPISTSTPTTSIISSTADVAFTQKTPQIQETTNMINENPTTTANTPKSTTAATTFVKSTEAGN